MINADVIARNRTESGDITWGVFSACQRANPVSAADDLEKMMLN